jgi:hypothetical protein
MKTLEKMLLSLILCGFITLSAQCSTTRPLLSDEYANKLELCAPYKENLFYKGLSTQGIFNVKSEETIIGIRSGKCVTNSIIRERASNNKLYTVTCQYKKEQYTKLSSMIKEAKLSQTKEKHYRQLNNYYLKQRPDVCQTYSHLEELND